MKRTMVAAAAILVLVLLTAVFTVLASAEDSAMKKHIVKKGQCLDTIARTYGLTWPELFSANQGRIKDPGKIYPSQVLVIPAKDSKVAKAKPSAKPAPLPFDWDKYKGNKVLIGGVEYLQIIEPKGQPRFLNETGRSKFRNRDVLKAIDKDPDLSAEVKLELKRVYRLGKPADFRMPSGMFLNAMFFGGYKRMPNTVTNWDASKLEACNLYTVEMGERIYCLAVLYKCGNPCWFVLEKPKPPIEFGCIQVKKQAYDKDGSPIKLVPEFSFSLDSGETTVHNDQTGLAKFEKVMPGQHQVSETLTDNKWKLESVMPNEGSVDVSPGDVCSEVTFINRQTPAGKPQVKEEELLLEEEELLLPLIFPTIEVAAEVPRIEFKIKPLIRKPCLVCKPDWEAWVYTGYHWGAQDHNRYDWDWYYGGNISLFACEIQIAGGIFRAGPSLQWVGWQGEVQRKIGYQGEMGLYGAELQYLKGNMKDQLKVYFGTKRGEVWGKGFDYSSSEKNRMWAFEGAHQQWRNKKWFPEWEVGFRLEIGQSSGWKNSSVNNVEIYDPAKDQNLYMGRFKTEVYRAKYFRPTFEISGGYRGFDDALLAEFRPGIRETYYNVAEVDVSYSWIEYSQNNMWGVHLLINASNAGGHIYRHIKRSMKASDKEKKASEEAPNGKFLDYRLNTIGP